MADIELYDALFAEDAIDAPHQPVGRLGRPTLFAAQAESNEVEHCRLPGVVLTDDTVESIIEAKLLAVSLI